jgi:hypothetical protein
VGHPNQLNCELNNSDNTTVLIKSCTSNPIQAIQLLSLL